MKGILYIQYDRNGNRVEKPEGIEVDLNVDKSGDAQAFTLGEKGRMIAQMSRARLEWAAAAGMTISGVEDVRGDRRKMHYQEWWFTV